MELALVALYCIGAWGFSNFILNENGVHDLETFCISAFWPVSVPLAILTGRIMPAGDE